MRAPDLCAAQPSGSLPRLLLGLEARVEAQAQVFWGPDPSQLTQGPPLGSSPPAHIDLLARA